MAVRSADGSGQGSVRDAASLLAPLATVFFERNVQAQWWWVLLLLVGLFAVGAFGFFSYRRLGQIYLGYLDNLLMLGFARQMTGVRP